MAFLQVAVLTHIHCISGRLLALPVHTQGHINSFRAVLVAHKDAVLSRIFHGDLVDSDGGALGLLSDGKLSLIKDFSIIAKPEDLRSRVAINEASQTQWLRSGQNKNDCQWKMSEVFITIVIYWQCFTLPSMIATTSGSPFITLARSANQQGTLS